MRTLGAAKFKAHCLATLDEVATKRESVVLTKNGRAVATLIPMPLEGEDPIFGFLEGQIEIVGDIVSAPYTDQEHEEFFQASTAQLK